MHLYSTQIDFYLTTSKEPVTFNNILYTPFNFDIKGLNWELKAGSKISITASNFDYTMSELVLNGLLTDIPVKVYLIYMYDNQYFYTVGTNYTVELNNSMAVTTAIPSDIPQMGILYEATTDTSTAVTISYTGWSGNRFITTSNIHFPKNMQFYIPKTSYNLTDAIEVFNGSTDEIELSETNAVIQCLSESVSTQFSPRRRITKENGFNFLPVEGTKILIFDELFTLESPRA